MIDLGMVDEALSLRTRVGRSERAWDAMEVYRK